MYRPRFPPCFRPTSEQREDLRKWYLVVRKKIKRVLLCPVGKQKATAVFLLRR